jgi:3-methylfumaryl-CoA hydratase
VVEDIEHLRQWIGKSEVAEETIALAPALRLLATLDDEGPPLRAGDPLPPLWHWLYFLSGVPTREIGTDGHARRGGFLPPVQLPRRMFAGARIVFHAPLRIGDSARRHREVLSIEPKEGRDGPLVFVGVTERIEQGGVVCIEEQQTIVYRGRGVARSAAALTPGWPQPPAGSWVRTMTPNPALLFRFSALTFNAHRIHYDRTYAMDEEGYPGLVVHGTLLALLLMELVRRNDARQVTHFSFRALAPLFDLAPFRLIGTANAQRVTLIAEGPGGARATEAEAILATLEQN